MEDDPTDAELALLERAAAEAEGTLDPARARRMKAALRRYARARAAVARTAAGSPGYADEIDPVDGTPGVDPI